MQIICANLTNFSDCRERGVPILVKVLASVDRSKGLDAATENVRLASLFRSRRPDVVVGVDVSGNVAVGDLKHLLPLLDEARRQGLRLAIHAAEVSNSIFNYIFVNSIKFGD